MIRVLIVDDEPIARRGIRQQLRSEADVEVIGGDGGVIPFLIATDNGSGDHPAYRPSSTTGEAMSLSTSTP